MNDQADSPVRRDNVAPRVHAAERERDDAARHRQRLVRAEMDLEAAIRECYEALAQVRRELSWTDAGASPIVH